VIDNWQTCDLYWDNVLFVQAMKGKKDTDLVGLIPGALETMKIKKEVLETGIAQGKELTVTMDGFGKRWLVVTCEALRNKAGQILGVITACMDVTEQVHLLLKVSLSFLNFYCAISCLPIAEQSMLKILCPQFVQDWCVVAGVSKGETCTNEGRNGCTRSN
jgi:hypothetical protein